MSAIVSKSFHMSATDSGTYNDDVPEFEWAKVPVHIVSIDSQCKFYLMTVLLGCSQFDRKKSLVKRLRRYADTSDCLTTQSETPR
jgi:hypothetical protein